MDIPEKLYSARIVYTLKLWAPGCLESGRSDSGRLDSSHLDRKKLKLHFTIKGAVADYDIFNSQF